MTDNTASYLLRGRQAKTCPRQPIDLQDPDQHLAPDLHAVYAELRRDDPVYWNKEDNGPGFWAVTRYDDVVSVLKSTDIFSADFRHGGIRIFDVKESTAHPRPSMLALDPPDHGGLRRALNPLFSQQRTATYALLARKQAHDLVARVAAVGRCEIVADIALPMVGGFLAFLLDVSDDDGVMLTRHARVINADDDREYTPATRARTLLKVDAYLKMLLDRPEQPARPNLIDALRRSRFNGAPLDKEMLWVNFCTFLIAATEMTQHSIARMMLALTRFPAFRAALRDRPADIDLAVKELLRWMSVTKHMRRTATQDVVLGGQAIRAGDKVVVWYEAANHDDSKWDIPGDLRFDRFASAACPGHLAFGTGVHHCIGWRFAELQVTAVLEEIMATIPDATAIDEGRPLRSNLMGGLKSLELRFTPHRAMGAVPADA